MECKHKYVLTGEIRNMAGEDKPIYKCKKCEAYFTDVDDGKVQVAPGCNYQQAYIQIEQGLVALEDINKTFGHLSKSQKEDLAETNPCSHGPFWYKPIMIRYKCHMCGKIEEKSLLNSPELGAVLMQVRQGYITADEIVNFHKNLAQEEISLLKSIKPCKHKNITDCKTCQGVPMKKCSDCGRQIHTKED